MTKAKKRLTARQRSDLIRQGYSVTVGHATAEQRRQRLSPPVEVIIGPTVAVRDGRIRVTKGVAARLSPRYADRFREFGTSGETDAVILKRLIRWAERQFAPKGKRPSLYRMAYVGQPPVEVACWLKEPKGAL